MLTTELPACPQCDYDEATGWTCHRECLCPLPRLQDTRAPYDDVDGNAVVALIWAALLYGVLGLLAWGLKGITW